MDDDERARLHDENDREMFAIRKLEREMGGEADGLERRLAGLEDDVQRAEHTIDDDMRAQELGGKPEHPPFWDADPSRRSGGPHARPSAQTQEHRTMTLHLAGHDGTERGDDALALGVRLARLCDAALLVVHVIGMPAVRDTFTGPVVEGLEEQAGVVLARASRTLGDLPGPAPRTVHASSPAAGLQEVCDAERPGLVTVGSTHRGALGRVVAGTTADRLLSGAPCAVGIAPRGYAGASVPFERIVVGYDGGDESRIALQAGAELASLAGVHLHVVVVSDDDEPAAREHAEHIAGGAAGHVTPHVVVEREVTVGEAGPALARAARAERDLLVIGSRGYGPVRSVLAGTVGHHLARHATSPVLVLPRGIDAGAVGALLGSARAGERTA